jgi:hypothetical protein
MEKFTLNKQVECTKEEYLEFKRLILAYRSEELRKHKESSAKKEAKLVKRIQEIEKQIKSLEEPCLK